MRLTLTIDMDGEAFNSYAGDEVDGIIRRQLLQRIAVMGDVSSMDALNGLVLRDSNGNTVGKVKVTK